MMRVSNQFCTTLSYKLFLQLTELCLSRKKVKMCAFLRTNHLVSANPLEGTHQNKFPIKLKLILGLTLLPAKIIIIGKFGRRLHIAVLL